MVLYALRAHFNHVFFATSAITTTAFEWQKKDSKREREREALLMRVARALLNHKPVALRRDIPCLQHLDLLIFKWKFASFNLTWAMSKTQGKEAGLQAAVEKCDWVHLGREQISQEEVSPCVHGA